MLSPSVALRGKAGMLLAAATNGSADVGKRRVRISAQGGDRGDTHHDDEGQHHGVFNGRWAIFISHEFNEVTSQS
jgi:hypothetical protein